LIIFAGCQLAKANRRLQRKQWSTSCGGAKNRHQKMIDYIGKLRSNGENATSLAQSLLWQPLNAKSIHTMTQCDSVLA
jgi:hypothetical protein